jgi:pimeloyl-ACP methyl ester carboxylesterase
MQRWAQPMISAHRTPLIDRHFAENLIPTDGHSYKALEIVWSYDLFARLACRPRRNALRTIASLIITAGHDPTFSQEMGEKLASHCQHSQHLHDPGASHIDG